MDIVYIFIILFSCLVTFIIFFNICNPKDEFCIIQESKLRYYIMYKNHHSKVWSKLNGRYESPEVAIKNGIDECFYKQNGFKHFNYIVKIKNIIDK